MTKALKMLATIIAMSVITIHVSGHSGRVDKQGGHYNRKTGTYHFHRASAPRTKTVSRTPTASPRKRRQIEEKWRTTVYADGFTNDRQHQAISPTITGQPYRNARMVFACNEEKDKHLLQVVFRFDYLNVRSRRDVTTGGDVLGVETLWSNNNEGSRETMKVGTKRLQTFDDYEMSWINNVSNHDWLKIRLHYFNHGAVTIQIPLNGAKEAVESIIESCGYEPEYPRYCAHEKVQELISQFGREGMREQIPTFDIDIARKFGVSKTDFDTVTPLRLARKNGCPTRR